MATTKKTTANKSQARGGTNKKALDNAAKVDAINKAQAVIEFELDGTIITANDNFLNALGYTLEEIQGQHHRIFVDPQYAVSPAYTEFWAKLNRGEFVAEQFQRFGKGGKEVWIEASYNPVFGPDGKPYKVVKFATDITEQKMQFADYQGQIEAIGKSQAVIEFELDGTIITANDNFLNALGYTLEEIKGKHHRIFVEPEYASSPAYTAFWDKLGRGEFEADEFKRIGKGGKVVWIQASYNPIFDPNGNPFKVVKYASDVTAQKLAEQAYRDEMTRIIDACTSGDLTARGDLDSLDETYRPVMQGINKILESFETALTQVAEPVLQVASASTQISEGASKLAEGANNQASSIEEISASLEEISSMTAQNADNSNEAKNLASTAQTSAQQGNETMQKMQKAIDEIKSSSDETAKIVRTIDEIAFQTNLLALNAAVEAARAGDAGKGFAVVAEEVRSLAQRSAEAAKNTAALIEQAVNNAESGVSISEQVSSILSEIFEGSTKVNDLISEIAAASNEQSDGIKQVNEAVDQINKITQDNAANSEESAAAAGQLNAQVEQLNDLINGFTLSQSLAAAPAATRRKAASDKSTTEAKTEKPASGELVGAGVDKASAQKAIPLDDDELKDF